MKIVLCIFFTCMLSISSESLNEKLEKIFLDHNLVGMSVVITQNDDIVFQGNFGVRDVKRKLPINNNTHYRIASISKMITATALMQLHEQNFFKLDENINKYLDFQIVNPHFPNTKITFQDLLSHTSGLRDSTAYSQFLQKMNTGTHIKELLQTKGEFYSTETFDSQNSPGYFKYANINFGIIATLIEKLSQQRFDMYCAQNIFAPLGIEASFNIDQLENIDNLAALYRWENDEIKPQADNYGGIPPQPRDFNNYVLASNGFLFSPQGGLRISANDLAKFLLAQQNQGQPILKKETTKLMQQNIWSFNGENGDNYYGIFNHYGFGCHNTDNLIPKENLIGHPGEAYGLISDMYFSPLKNFGIIFVTNGGEWQEGSYSGWYNIEEKVFLACYQHILAEK